MSLTPVPTPYPQRGDRSTFAGRVDAFVTWLQNAPAEFDAFLGSLTTLAAGGAYSVPYTFSTTTTDADPGNGLLCLSSATQNTSTVIRADLVGSDTKTYTSVLDTMDDSTSTVKGHILLQKLNDPTKWLLFSVAGLASPTGYKNLTVACVASSEANPFVNGNALILKFQRTGDKGETGTSGTSGVTTFHVREEQANNVAPAAGTLISGITYRRVLNTVKTNGISGASLATNQITLPAGTYNYRARATVRSNGGHKLCLYNVTDAVYLGIGSSSYGLDYTAASDFTFADSEVVGQIVFAAPKVIELRSLINTLASGWGLQANVGQVEVYTEAFFEKIA